MTQLAQIRRKDVHRAINDRGNMEQHRTIGGYIGWAGNRKARRKGSVIRNRHLSVKTGQSISFFPFY